MNRIEQTYVINATPPEVWSALTDPELIRQWSGSSALFTPEPQTEYSLWNGDIQGRVIEVIPMERLVQTWEPRNWNLVNSVVTFVLTPIDGGTRVDLTHSNVEEWDYDGTSEGWDIYYLGAIKRLLDARNTPTQVRSPSALRQATPKRVAKKTPRRMATKKTTTKKRAVKKTTAVKQTGAKKRAVKKRAAASKSAAKKSRRR